MTSRHRYDSFSLPASGRRCFYAAVLLLGALIVTATAWGQSPRPGSQPLGPDNRLQPSAADRCPVCAMRPAKYPRFASAIQLQDMTTFYFCSPGCMLKAWLRPAIFLGTGAGDLKLPVSQEYFSGQPVDARTVFWVSGSDVVGPMGPALVPLQKTTHVDVFRRRHGGNHIFRLEDLNADNWKALTGKPFRF